MWQRESDTARRLAPSSWDDPDLGDWAGALTSAVEGTGGPAVLVAHSLGTLLVAHWAAGDDETRAVEKVSGAFLVSIPDPSTPAFPAEGSGFGSVPRKPLPFPALVVASSDDPYGDLAYQRRMAEHWGADFVHAGALGHISSNAGRWAQGRDLCAAFVSRLDARR